MRRSRHLQGLRSTRAVNSVDQRPAGDTRAHGRGYADTVTVQPLPPVTSSKRDEDLAKTLSFDDAGGLVLSAGGPPVAYWDRYELLELLGMGGMGVVYKARDRRLDRILAIKFLLCADPNLTVRFLREARAQARIDHPNVCRVYEVGEISGRAYIALQRVDGEPLHHAASRMSLDEKIAVMRDVAAAVHEAHRLGIVHRDLKPANVMVERTERGYWFPVVMDFGLAREATVDAGITESGTLLGTPAYMSPEQARGDVRAVDRRSDVYSLGATLYELLTGRPPFAPAALADALAQVIHDDPPAPRGLVPSLPADLETITLKCLAKDPAERYPSARALSDDLAHYLDGEPILGRRLSRWRRLRLRVRRHRALVVLGAWSLAIVIAVASLGVRAWLTSRSELARTAERTRLAELLGHAEKIEFSLRLAYLLPLHDTRPDREVIRAEMRTIAASPHDRGDLDDAVIHDALGRGYLALHQWREAADELERAEAAGLQTPELHAARGHALGELYHRAFEEVHRSGDKAWLDLREKELEQQYLTPAMAELDRSRGSGEDSALLAARLALYRRDFATAEMIVQAVAAHAPALSDARKLAADVAYGAALEAFDHGNYDTARLELDRAATQYAEASEIARSDASMYEAAAEAWLARAEVDFRQGRSPREPLEHALDALERALHANPDDATAYTTKAYVLLRWFRTPSLAGQGDQRPLLDRIAQAAARAAGTDPRDESAWDALGNAHLYRGIYEHDHGGRGAPWWNRARHDFDQALAIQPNDLEANNNLCTAHRWLGTSLDEAGYDPMPEYQQALRCYERATTLDPHYVDAWTNQADLYTTIAEHDRALGIDPRPAVDSARRTGEHCLAIDPNFYSPLHTLARAQLALAGYLVETGGDATAALASSRGYLDRADTVQPGSMATWFYRFTAAATEAKLRLRDGADPTSSIMTGRAALKEVLRLEPDVAYTYVEAARLELVAAASAGHTASGPAEPLASARALAEKAIALNGQLADAKLTAAEVCLQIAMARTSPAVVESGITYVDQALAINPRLPRAQSVRAALLRLHAP